MGSIEGVFEVYHIAYFFFSKAVYDLIVAYEHIDTRIDSNLFFSELLYPISINPPRHASQTLIACFGFPRGAKPTLVSRSENAVQRQQHRRASAPRNAPTGV